MNVLVMIQSVVSISYCLERIMNFTSQLTQLLRSSLASTTALLYFALEVPKSVSKAYVTLVRGSVLVLMSAYSLG